MLQLPPPLKRWNGEDTLILPTFWLDTLVLLISIYWQDNLKLSVREPSSLHVYRSNREKSLHCPPVHVLSAPLLWLTSHMHGGQLTPSTSSNSGNLQHKISLACTQEDHSTFPVHNLSVLPYCWFGLAYNIILISFKLSCLTICHLYFVVLTFIQIKISSSSPPKPKS